MKQIKNILSICFLLTVLIACQEKYDMIPIPDPNVEPPEVETPRFEKLYLVGSFTGWNFEEMWEDVNESTVFRYGREFNGDGGEFKFGTAIDDSKWDNMFHPTVSDAPYTHSQVILGESLGDLKWILTEEECNQAYKIVFQTKEGSESFSMTPFTPYEMIYLVGSASPSEWNVGDAEPMEEVSGNPYKFTWTGDLSSGELKFSCDRKNDWNGAWFLASEGGLTPDGEWQQMRYSPSNDGGSDDKWMIEQAGTYTIELDQLMEIVKITKH